jgi:alcohol dehydrogenase
MNQWSFYNPTKVVRGNNIIEDISSHVDFDRPILITSPGFVDRGIVKGIEDSMGKRLRGVFTIVRSNPEIESIDAVLESIKNAKPDCLIALGGGSSIDTAKALSRMIPLKNHITLVDHFRKGIPFGEARGIPIIAIPTTAGTGAEVTPFGTIWDQGLKKKYSIEGMDLFPLIALIDPMLTIELPIDVTVSTGLDAISHALESAWNVKANPITLGFAESSLSRSLQTLPSLVETNVDPVLRGKMMDSALLAGLSISHTHTSIAHSISYPLTIRFGVPHGLACSFALPEILRFNSQTSDHKMDDLARKVGFDSSESLAKYLEHLLLRLNVPKRIEYYIPDLRVVNTLTREMVIKNRTGNNIRPIVVEDIEMIITDAIKRSNDYGINHLDSQGW